MDAARTYAGLLLPFARHGKAAPYSATLDTRPGTRICRVVPAHCKTGIAASRQSLIPHLVTSAAAVLVDGRLTFGTRWLCSPDPFGAGSQDAVIISDPAKLGGLCKRCSLMDADGPGVYRFRDRDGRLLYIGSSGGVRVRIAFHQKNAPWRSLIADVQITRYPSLPEARIAESVAIGTESPLMNKTGVRREAA